MSFKDKVIYQIYPKSFQDSNGDGWGDIQGIISRLDYLKELGVDCLWLNPMTVSPQRDNGYDVANYREIDSRYGTMADFEALIKEADQRGITIMLDMVFNHTSTEHEWFQRALKGEKKYQDYYFFRDGSPDRAITNWQSKFGGPAWEYVPSIKKWYLHLYDVTQADLNWDNPEVRKECADIVRFWMSKGVKGFRFDVVNLISKATVEEDDPNEFDGRQFYTDGPHVHEYLRELNENSFGQDPSIITVGEMSSTTIENCVKYTGFDAHELSMVFSFHHLKVDYHNQMKWELQEVDFPLLKHLLNSWQVGMQENRAWNALFLNNHDQPRSLSRFGDDKEYRKESATMLATIIHLMRGTPYIFQGEEIGMTNAYFDNIDDYVDVESRNIFSIMKEEGKKEEEIYKILQARSRDNARTPMQWNEEENAGFTSGKPWLKVNENYKQINVEEERNKKNSILSYYKQLIQLRKKMPVIQDGLYEPLYEDHPSLFAYKRTLKDEEIIVLANFYKEKIQLDEAYEGYRVLLSNVKKEVYDQELGSYEVVVLIKE